MTSIVTKRINGYGPYAYRVEFTGESHEWEYLGPAGSVDPADLTDEETAELRNEGFALARYRDTETVQFGDRSTANELRDELPDAVIAPTDDRRSDELELLDDELSREEQAYIEGKAADSRKRETYQHGQADLTRAERRALDFGETGTNVPHARTSKAILQGEGVDDWRAYYDPDLTPSEHVEVAETARQDEQGARADREDAQATRQAADQFRASQGARRTRLREACENGTQAACEEMREMGLDTPA